MKCRGLTLGCRLLVALHLATSALPPASAQTPTYTLTDLGRLPGHTRSEPVAINNQGHVVGVSMVPNTWNYRAFVYRDGRLSDLGAPGWEASQAADINDAGQIVVNAFRPNPDKPGYAVTHAFLTRDGTWTDLGTSSPWKNSLGHGLNALGQVVGEESDGTNTFAFLWNGVTKRYLASAAGILTNAAARSVNDFAQVLVGSEDGTFVHQGTILTPLALPGNGNWGLGTLNNRGQAVGHFEVDTPLDPGDPEGETLSQRHAFRWQAGRLTDLSPTNCLDSAAFDINAHGQAVGYCLAPSTTGSEFPEPLAVLFQNGTVVDLNSLLPANSGWRLIYATAINNLGQIACLASSPSNGIRAVLLTPPFCTLAPATVTNQVGQSHEVTCTIVSNTVPLPGLTVRFAIVSGPNQDTPGSTATAVTDAAGQARFRYTGNRGGGTDLIEARSQLGPLSLLASAECTWEAGIELHPRLVIGCPGGSTDLELIDLATGRNIAADPDVEYEWIGDDWLSNLAWKALEKALPGIAGARATIDVRQGRVTFRTKGVNLINAKRKTAQGEIKSNYAFVAVGVLELAKLDSLEIGPLDAVNLAKDTAAGKITAALGAEFPIRSPMILFPTEEAPCGGVIQKLGNVGFVELRSLKFNFLGGLIEDVDLMNAVGPLVGLASKAFPLAWLADGLSTRAVKVGAAQLLEFEVGAATADPDADNPFIDLAEDNSEFPYIRGRVTAKKSGLAVVQAKLDLAAYCLGDATDLMWVWVLPDLEKVEIRNAQGQLVRDAAQVELPLGVWVNQSTQAVAVGSFRNFAEAGRIPIEFDPFGVQDSDLAKLAEKLLPGYAKIQDRVGVSLPIRYPLGTEAGPGGLYEGGSTHFALTVTYLPLVPAIRVDEFRLQLPIWNGFNTWALAPSPNPYARLDPGQAILTGAAPGLTDLHLDTCIYGLSKATDTARVRVMAGDPVCTVQPAALQLKVAELTTLEASITVDGQPAPPGEVNFTVVSGPNAGQHGSDRGPLARFSYQGTGGPGTDRIEVVGFAWGRICGASATRTWVPEAEKQADLALTKTAAPHPAVVGEPLTYTLELGNLGPDVATGVTLVDTLPPDLEFISASASQGACAGSGPVTCSLGTLARGASATVTLRVRPLAAGTYVNLAQASAREQDPNPANNQARTATPVIERPAAASADLAVTLAHPPTTLYPGQSLPYQMTVRNLGPNPATGVTATELLSTPVRFESATPSQGDVRGLNPFVWDVGPLTSNGTASLRLTVRPLLAGRLEATATVEAREPDPNPANNRVTDALTVSSGPVITRITPEAAPPGVDGLELRIEGTGFEPGAAVTFQPGTGIESWDDGVPDFGFVGPTELRRLISVDPTSPPGIREVFLTNPSGPSGGGFPQGRFTVLAPDQPLPRPTGITIWLTGDGSASDLLGRNPGILVNGAAADAQGQVGPSFRFDGVDDAVEIPSQPAVDFAGATPMTLEAWVYRTSPAPAMFLLGKQQGCDSSRLQYRLGVNPTEGIYFETARGLVGTGESLPLNRWTHLAITANGGELGVYIDGFLSGLDDGLLGPATTAPLRLGGCGTCSGAFGGRLDEITLYDRELTEGEIQALAAAGRAGKSKIASAPALTVAVGLASQPGTLLLTWPLSAAGYVLEENARLGSPSGWVPTTALPTVSAGQHRIILGPDRGTRYYRLTHP